MPLKRRNNHFGVLRDARVATRLIAPGTQITSPRMQASKPSRATSSTLPIRNPGSFDNCPFASVAALSMWVAVMPGQSAVIVTPVPFNSSDNDSVSDNTYALLAA